MEALLLLKQKRSYACCHILGVMCETAILLIAARFSSFQPRVSVYAHLVISSSSVSLACRVADKTLITRAAVAYRDETGKLPLPWPMCKRRLRNR